MDMSLLLRAVEEIKFELEKTIANAMKTVNGLKKLSSEARISS